MNDEKELFEKAMRDVLPLKKKNKNKHTSDNQKPKPIPKKFLEDEKEALIETLSNDFESLEYFLLQEELHYLKKGHSPDIVKKLRQGFWKVQGAIDLHGLTSIEAKNELTNYISHCKANNIRCIRIIHGKGLNSINKEPILKNKVKKWLMQKEEVICFVQAKNNEGGSGALKVLFK